MSPIKRNMIDQARERFGQILPCVGKTWDECFHLHDHGVFMFYFNDLAGNTHVITEREAL